MNKTGQISVFLSGSVNKGKSDTRNDEHFWSEEQEKILMKINNGNVILVNPNNLDVDHRDFMGRYEGDINMLLGCQLVLVDARTKKGIGIGAEMMLAKMKSIPVFSWCPLNTHYHKTKRDDKNNEEYEWIHPFIIGLSDRVFDDLEDLVIEINNLITSGNISLK
jgi:hypothetical protein